MEIKDIKCTCTPEQRELTFKTLINEKVEKLLISFDYNTKHLSDSEKMELILKEIKAFEFVFSDDFLEPEHRRPRFFNFPYAYERGHANVWRDFKTNYEKRFGNEFRDFHLESCHTLQPRTNEIGETYKPLNPNNKYLHPWLNYAYFFYLRLKDRVKGEATKDLKSKLIDNNNFFAIRTDIKKTPQEIIREKFINKLSTEYNFNTILIKYNHHKEEIISDIIEKDIPYIFALFEHLNYRKTLLDLFKDKSKVYFFNKLGTLLYKNTRDITGFWNVLNPNSKESKINYTSNDYLEEIQSKYPI